MKKGILLFFIVLIALNAHTQDPGKMVVKFSKDPLLVIKKNKDRYFTDEEFLRLREFGLIGLGVSIDYETKKILSVKYSPISMAYDELAKNDTLEDSLSIKLGEIIMKNVEVKKVLLIPERKEAPNEVNFILTLEF